VSNQTRREVAERDGLGCTFVNASGERCGERAFLELDHRKAKGEGGGSEPDNVRMLCRSHNQLEAERVYGKAFMERKRNRKRKRNWNGNLLVRDGMRRSNEFVSGFGHPRRRGSSFRRAGRMLATSLADQLV
jgi:hypothetical protein